MLDCKRGKSQTDFIVGVDDYSAKWFSEIEHSVYEIGSISINGLADEETITVQEPVTRFGCRQ